MRISTVIKRPSKTPHSAAAVLPAALFVSMFLPACQPTVKVEAPEEPITINLNVKLDADVRVKLEEQAQKDIERNEDIF